MGVSDRIAELRAEYARTQKNKATEGHLGLIKARIARLEAEEKARESKSSKGASKATFETARAGNARIAMIGLPSVGKSTLMSYLTGVQTETSSVDFTTLTAVPGFLNGEDCLPEDLDFFTSAKIQLIDLPGIIGGAASGSGRGRQVLAAARGADVIMLLVDGTKQKEQLDLLYDELYQANIRVNQQKPRIVIQPMGEGGINIIWDKPTIDFRVLKNILNEFKIFHAVVNIHEPITLDQFVDHVSGNRAYIPGIIVYSKLDCIPIQEAKALVEDGGICISSKKRWNLDLLLAEIRQQLKLVRVYTKRHGDPLPSTEKPVVFTARSKATPQNAAKKIHSDLLKASAVWVWGSSVTFSPCQVKWDHELHDGDVISFA